MLKWNKYANTERPVRRETVPHCICSDIAVLDRSSVWRTPVWMAALPDDLWEEGRQKGPNLKTPSRAGKTSTICFFKRAPSLDKRVGGCRDTYFMSAGQSHHQTLSFLFTVNQSRRHAILWRQMPWDHRLMSMCLHLQSWNECKIRLSARITAANYTTDHLRFRNLELIKKKNKSKFRDFTWTKNGSLSVKLKGKWH